MAALLASKTKATKELVSPFRQTKKIKHANWCRNGSSRRQGLCFFWCVDCLLSKRWSGQKIFEIESPRLPPIKSSLEPNVFTTWHYEEFDSSLWPTPFDVYDVLRSAMDTTGKVNLHLTLELSDVCTEMPLTATWGLVYKARANSWPGEILDLGISTKSSFFFRSYKAVYKSRRCWFTLKPQL